MNTRVIIAPSLTGSAGQRPQVSTSGTIQVSISKGKKKGGNARSKFLSELMKRSSGDLGNTLADAFVNGDADAFAKGFDKLKGSILNTIQKSGKQ